MEQNHWKHNLINQIHENQFNYAAHKKPHAIIKKVAIFFVFLNYALFIHKSMNSVIWTS